MIVAVVYSIDILTIYVGCDILRVLSKLYSVLSVVLLRMKSVGEVK